MQIFQNGVLLQCENFKYLEMLNVKDSSLVLWTMLVSIIHLKQKRPYLGSKIVLPPSQFKTTKNLQQKHWKPLTCPRLNFSPLNKRVKD